MINLLPPTTKEQVKYARLNKLALKYVRGLVVVVVVLTAIFGGTYYLMQDRAQKVRAQHDQTMQDIAATGAFQKEAQVVSDRLAAIKQVQASQTRFSLLLADLAKVLPKDVALDAITLTGDDKKPVRISVNGATYDSILAFREALSKSARVSGVDLESIAASTTSAGGFQASVVIGFKPGMAK